MKTNTTSSTLLLAATTMISSALLQPGAANANTGFGTWVHTATVSTKDDGSVQVSFQESIPTESCNTNTVKIVSGAVGRQAMISTAHASLLSGRTVKVWVTKSGADCVLNEIQMN